MVLYKEFIALTVLLNNTLYVQHDPGVFNVLICANTNMAPCRSPTGYQMMDWCKINNDDFAHKWHINRNLQNISKWYYKFHINYVNKTNFNTQWNVLYSKDYQNNQTGYLGELKNNNIQYNNNNNELFLCIVVLIIMAIKIIKTVYRLYKHIKNLSPISQ